MPEQSFSHYRILHKIGEGGMGEVFLAHDELLDRKVAIKFLPALIARDEHARARFDREAKAAAAINHPNIIIVHEVGVHEEKPYIAMAFVEGESLSAILRRKRLPVGRAIAIAAQVCDGLAEAHTKGIVHRDIKPGNIHIDERGHARILDFGLALRPDLSKITKPDTVVGTISYMSPEQATGRDVDSRSDIFSLGSVLYEMLTGEAAFQGPQIEAVIVSIVSQAPPPIRSLNPNVGEDLAHVIARAMEKDPARRYQSAGEMALALRAARRAAAKIEEKQRKRRRLVRGGIAAAVLVIAAVSFHRDIERVADYLYGRLFKHSHTLAVLPFKNLSGDAGQQYFVDGMTEETIARLAQVNDLKLISRTSAMHFQGSTKTLKEIANQLGADRIVEGSVVRASGQIKVTAQLIDAETDNHIWADSFTAADSNVIALQTTLATEIAQQVKAHLSTEDRQRLFAHAPANNEAYEAYLQGRFYFNRRMPADIARALDYFTHAIDVDPNYAPAFAGIADCYTVRAMWNWDTSQNTFPRARFACEQALRIDPSLAEAHASLAMVQLFYDWDWTAAEKSFKKSIDLNPSYATAYHWYGLALLSLGRYKEAIDRMETACALDPFAPIMRVTLSQAYDLNGNDTKATENVDKALTVFPEFGYALLAKSWIAYHQKDYAEAVNCARKAMRAHVDRSEVMLVAGLDGLGRKDEAEQALKEAMARPGVPYHVRATLYAYDAEPDSAIAMTRRAIAAREWFVVAFRNRWLEPMQKNPQFKALLKEQAPIHGVD
jgi:serine/threonine protein kinase/Tfp pilus assembly protein PilF